MCGRVSREGIPLKKRCENGLSHQRTSGQPGFTVVS